MISQELRRIREEKNISLTKASQDLRISEKHLITLESGHIGQLPAGVYGRNFLKSYARYLGLEADKIAYEYFGGEIKTKQEDRELFVRQAPHAFYFLTIPRLLRSLFLFVLALSLLAYLAYAVYNIISPPELIVSSPAADRQTRERSLLVAGLTEPESNVLINGEAALVGDNGGFEKTVNLQVGINNILVSSQKKYSRTNYISRKILVEADK